MTPSTSEPAEEAGATEQRDQDEGTRRDESDDTTGTGPLLAVEGVSKSFGDLRVLEEVTFEVERSSVVALVGPNGSGKTTLLRILAGLVPGGGRVTLAASGPRTVGYLPQSPAFRPGFTVRETLEFYASLLAGDADVDGALAQVGLTAARDRRVEDLSGGMRRLLGLAQATLGDPAVLLLDEPTSDLDPRMTAHVFDAVSRLAEEGVAVVLATHDPRGVDRSDQALLLSDGRIAARGTPASFREGHPDAISGLFAAVREDEGTVPQVGAAAREVSERE